MKDGSSRRDKRQKCCVGALYYSQALMDRRAGPVMNLLRASTLSALLQICGGMKRTRRNPQPIQELQTDSNNLSDFKVWHLQYWKLLDDFVQYVCLGYSVWDEDRFRRQDIDMTDSTVNLPYCEGVEVRCRGIPDGFRIL